MLRKIAHRRKPKGFFPIPGFSFKTCECHVTKPPRAECEIKRMRTPQRRTVMITCLFALAQLPPLITKSNCHTKSTSLCRNVAPTDTNVTLSIAKGITPFLSNRLNISIRRHQSRGSKQLPAGMRFPTRYGAHYVALLYEKDYKVPFITGDYSACQKNNS